MYLSLVCYIPFERGLYYIKMSIWFRPVTCIEVCRNGHKRLMADEAQRKKEEDRLEISGRRLEKSFLIKTCRRVTATKRHTTTIGKSVRCNGQWFIFQ